MLFEVRVDGAGSLLDHLDGMILRARAPRPLLDDSADRIELLTAAAFTDEGPAWRPLALSTQRDRARRGYSPAHPILVRSGALRASATAKGAGGGRNHIRRYAGAKSIEVGTSLPYARFHEYGTRRMPARPFYVITRADAALFTVVAADYLMGRWQSTATAAARRTA